MNGDKVATCQERLAILFDSLPENDSAIASSLGVSKQTISAWKSGIRSPKRTMVEKISEVYGVDIAWIMGYDVPMKVSSAPKDSSLRTMRPEDYDRLEALHQNPRLGLLFDRVKDLDEEDIQFMEKYANAIIKERDGD